MLKMINEDEENLTNHLPVNLYAISCRSAEQGRAYSLLQACRPGQQETAAGSPVVFNQWLLSA
jgi:hypothetical protein